VPLFSSLVREELLNSWNLASKTIHQSVVWCTTYFDLLNRLYENYHCVRYTERQTDRQTDNYYSNSEHLSDLTTWAKIQYKSEALSMLTISVERFLLCSFAKNRRLGPNISHDFPSFESSRVEICSRYHCYLDDY